MFLRRLPWQQQQDHDNEGKTTDRSLEDQDIVHVELAAIVDDQHTYDSPSSTQEVHCPFSGNLVLQSPGISFVQEHVDIIRNRIISRAWGA